MNCNEIKHRNCLITGANSGIGKQLSLELGKRGAHVIMVCRNKEKGLGAQEEVRERAKNKNIDMIVFDLSLKKSIQDGISFIKEKYGHIDVLINNAGVLLFKKELTGEGMEKTLATNYLGPFFLTVQILKMNDPERSCKVINVVSEGLGDEFFVPDLTGNAEKYSGINAYSFSKQAEIYFTFEMAERLKTSKNSINCFYPGLVQTNLGKPEKGFFRFTFTLMSKLLQSKFVSIEESIQLCLFLLCSEKASQMNGCYLKKEHDRIKVVREYNKEISKKLWEKTVNIYRTIQPPLPEQDLSE